jgi:hypothetical protein
LCPELYFISFWDVDRTIVLHAVFSDKAAVDGYVEWDKSTMRELVQEKTYHYDGLPRTCRHRQGRHQSRLHALGGQLGVQNSAEDRGEPKGLFMEQ